MTETRIHPITGEALTRQVRTHAVAFGSLSREVEVPGWYPEGDGDAIHTGHDLAAEDQVFRSLRKDYGERVRKIRKALRPMPGEAGQPIGGGPKSSSEV